MNLILILILTWFQGNEWDKANREVVRLAPSSFKQLSRELIQELERRRCTVTQISGSRQLGNVIRGQFLKKGQSDWAVLCSVNMKSSILVFANGSPGNPINIADGEDLNMLQGVSWGHIVNLVRPHSYREHFSRCRLLIPSPALNHYPRQQSKANAQFFFMDIRNQT
jgi:hypothetical protein